MASTQILESKYNHFNRVIIQKILTTFNSAFVVNFPVVLTGIVALLSMIPFQAFISMIKAFAKTINCVHRHSLATV